MIADIQASSLSTISLDKRVISLFTTKELEIFFLIRSSFSIISLKLFLSTKSLDKRVISLFTNKELETFFLIRSSFSITSLKLSPACKVGQCIWLNRKNSGPLNQNLLLTISEANNPREIKSAGLFFEFTNFQAVANVN